MVPLPGFAMARYLLINIWSYWLAWSPVLAIGAALAGSYIVTAFFANTAFGKFSVTLLDLSAILPELAFSGSILIGIVILLLSFTCSIQVSCERRELSFPSAAVADSIILLGVVP
jgi:amino acid transporter